MKFFKNIFKLVRWGSRVRFPSPAPFMTGDSCLFYCSFGNRTKVLALSGPDRTKVLPASAKNLPLATFLNASPRHQLHSLKVAKPLYFPRALAIFYSHFLTKILSPKDICCQIRKQLLSKFAPKED